MTSPKTNHTLRKVSAFLYLATLIASLIVVGTAGATFTPTQIFPITSSALASLFALLSTLHSFLYVSSSTTLHLTTTCLSTVFAACMIGIAYIRGHSAILPCTAGQVGGDNDNPYVGVCQLRQAMFWAAGLAALGFLGSAVVSGLLYWGVKRERAAAADFDSGLVGSGKDVEGGGGVE